MPYGMGCILSLLRNWACGGWFARGRLRLCLWFRRAYGTRFRGGSFPSAEALGYFRASLWDAWLRRWRVLCTRLRFEIVCWDCARFARWTADGGRPHMAYCRIRGWL